MSLMQRLFIKLIEGVKMKVVINKCYGGFGISQKAVKMLLKMNSTAIDKKPLEKYFGWNGIPDFKTSKRYNGEKEYVFDGEHYYQTYLDYVLFDEEFSYRIKDNYEHPEIRSHPDLIKVIEELGKEANGDCAELVIVEIPDDVKYEIDEYDGMESIHEEHRSW